MGYTACLAGRGRQHIRGGESEAVHGWAKGMKPEVCFVVGLVSFSGTAGVLERRKGEEHRGLKFHHFFSFPLPECLNSRLLFCLWLVSVLIFRLTQAFVSTFFFFFYQPLCDVSNGNVIFTGCVSASHSATLHILKRTLS